uniref:Uncharacterized protein n=1 Tax=Arundo donax TaxID=35708 RepID=A0A0A9BYL6_ARUDO
MMFGLFQTAK